MTLLTFEVFKTIADVGSFHKAADILGLTPSAISHAISSMENELGFSVLTRSKAGVSLTNYGEQLLPYVNAVLNCDESLKQEIPCPPTKNRQNRPRRWIRFPVRI